MAIKVIPSFTATDLFDVVLFNAHARRLQLERRTAIPALSDVCTPPERAGQEWSDADYAHYGLRHGVSGEWLEGSKTLTQYGFDGGDTRDELEFLVRYRFIRVRASNHPFELAVQETDTVDHVCREIVDKLVNAGLTPAPHDHDKFALFTGGSERLTPDSHVWGVLNEHSVLV